MDEKAHRQQVSLLPRPRSLARARSPAPAQTRTLRRDLYGHPHTSKCTVDEFAAKIIALGGRDPRNGMPFFIPSVDSWHSSMFGDAKNYHIFRIPSLERLVNDGMPYSCKNTTVVIRVTNTAKTLTVEEWGEAKAYRPKA